MNRGVWRAAGLMAVVGIRLSLEAAGYRTVLHSTRFEGTALPEGWVEQGGWRVKDGLETPGTGNFATFAVWNRQTTLECSVVEAWLELTTADARLGLVRRDLFVGNGGTWPMGSVGLLDGPAGKLRILEAWDGTNAPAPLTSVDLPFPLVPAHPYRLMLWKTDHGHHAFGLWDEANGEGAVATALRERASNPGKQLEAPGLVFLEGGARCTRLDYWTAFPPDPRLIVFGDSNTEGEAMKPDYESRYCKLAANALAGDCVLAPRGQETARSLLMHLDTDLDRFAASYVFLMLGTAEPDFNDWRDHLERVIARIQARGAVPVLATIPPKEDRMPFNDAVNQWVRGRGLRFVDFAKALARDSDGLVWDSRLHLADAIHPNVPGNRVMFERWQAEVPEVFAGASNRAPCRTLSLPTTNGVPGGQLRFPVRLTALGNESQLAFSLLMDPAALQVKAIVRGADLPDDAVLDTDLTASTSGRVGCTVRFPPGQRFAAGTHEIGALQLEVAARPPGGWSPIRFHDTPTVRYVVSPGFEVCEDGGVMLPASTNAPAPWEFDGAGTDVVWVEDGWPADAVVVTHGVEEGGWTRSEPPPVSGGLCYVSPSRTGPHGFYFWRPGAWELEPGDNLVAYVRLDPDQPPSMLVLQWMDGEASWDHQAWWGEALWPYGADTPTARRAMGPLPNPGRWVRLEVPAQWVGLEGATVRGLGVVFQDGGGAVDHAGRVTRSQDRLWLTDALPEGAEPSDTATEPWLWEADGVAPFVGMPTHSSRSATGFRRHAFTVSGQRWPVGLRDSLVSWVRLDPGNEPRMLGIEWRDGEGSWEHRAYWGEDRWSAGTRETPSRRWMGPLPIAGRWVHLSVPAALIGLEGSAVSGVAFGVEDGIARWAWAGTSSPTVASGRVLLTGLRQRGPESLELAGVAPPGQVWILQSSTDFLDWRWTATIQGCGRTNVLLSLPHVTDAVRFYRGFALP